MEFFPNIMPARKHPTEFRTSLKSMEGFEPSPPVQQVSVHPSTPLPFGFKAKLKE